MKSLLEVLLAGDWKNVVVCGEGAAEIVERLSLLRPGGLPFHVRSGRPNELTDCVVRVGSNASFWFGTRGGPACQVIRWKPKED